MAKDSPRITAGELQKKVVLGSEILKKMTKQPHVVWEGFKKKKKTRKENAVTKKLFPVYSVVRHD